MEVVTKEIYHIPQKVKSLWKSANPSWTKMEFQIDSLSKNIKMAD